LEFLLTNQQFLIDWLHAADQGISAVFLASVFLFVLPKFPGDCEADRLSALFVSMCAYYNHHSIESRLDNLTLKMLGKKSKPRLRAEAAEVRALINFACEVVDTHLSDPDLVGQSVKIAAKHLQTCYAMLSPANYRPEVLAVSSRKFCILLIELNKRNPVFRILPKIHLFQELCEMSTICPSLTWCYRDEDFGGSVASYSRVRGGANRALNIDKSVLLKFIAQHKLPRL
jgi:hypothetical protein